MRSRLLAVFFLATISGSALFAQTGGTITGSVADPAGAVIAGAEIQARNSETGVVYTGATSNTGNYTFSNLPVGSYEVSVSVAGFKKYTRQNLQVQQAATLR